MSSSPFWIFGVGFAAQLFFAARMIVQWVKSEQAGKPLSPVIFWQLSLIGSLLFLFYGILRHDFAIILGQLLVYFIYIRNLHLKMRWSTIHRSFRIFIVTFPLVALGFLLTNDHGIFYSDLANKEIPFPLLIWGSAGQVIFTLRFYIQWFDSESNHESVLTRRFWLFSLIGSLMIITYAVLRYDPVLLIGQLSGLIVYLRNLMLGRLKK
jgi:lipid-A-disaccharide synthase-like uncharacterized protein